MSINLKKGSLNQSITIRIVDSTDGTPETGVAWNTAGIDMQYRREGAANVAITEATLAALTTAHTDGGFLHIGNGYYRLDVPDLAFATGADGVLIHGTVTGMVVIGEYVQLVDYDPFDAVRMGMTSLPAAAADAAGGLATSAGGATGIDDLATSTAQTTAQNDLDLLTGTDGATLATAQGNYAPSKAGDAMALTAAAVDAVWDEATAGHAGAGSTGKALTDTLADTNELQGDWKDTGRLDNILDARMAEASINTTGGAVDAVTAITNLANLESWMGQGQTGTADSGTTTTLVDAALTEADNIWIGALLVFTGGALVKQSAIVTDFDAVSDTLTFAPAATTGVTTETYLLIPSGRQLMRGTDNAALASEVTAARMSELDAGTSGKLANVADAIKVVTDKFAFTVANRVDSNALSVGGTAQTAGDLAALITTADAAIDVAVADLANGTDGLGALKTAIEAVMTTQMTEAYAANGVAPTPAQALFAMHQMLMQFGIASTSLTVRKLNNIDPAFVVTLDDATAPTDAKRV